MIVIVLNRSLYALKLLSNLVIACPINHPYAYRPRRLCPTPNAPTDQPRSSEARQRRRLETRVHDVAVGIRVPLLGHLLTRRGVKRRRSQSAHGLRSAATGGSATSAAILFSSAKHETYTSTGLWIRSCARSAEMTRGCPRLHAHRAEGPLLLSRAAGGHTTYACVCHAHAASRNAPPAALSTRCARGDGAASRHRATCALR